MAKIFKRIKNLISANVNDLIDKVEDPDRMIMVTIREMEEKITKAGRIIADAAASENELFKSVSRHKNESGIWLAKAEDAMKSGKEEDARIALAQRKEHGRMAADLEVALAEAEKTTARLKERLLSMENELERVRLKRSILAARQRAAEASENMNTTISQIRDGVDSEERFARMEDKVLETESRAEAIEDLQRGETLEKEMDRLVDVELEDELAALRKKIHGKKSFDG